MLVSWRIVHVSLSLDKLHNTAVARGPVHAVCPSGHNLCSFWSLFAECSRGDMRPRAPGPLVSTLAAAALPRLVDQQTLMGGRMGAGHPRVIQGGLDSELQGLSTTIHVPQSL